MIYIIGFILVGLLGFFIGFLIYNPKRIEIIHSNSIIKETNIKLHEENGRLRESIEEGKKELDSIISKQRYMQDTINDSIEEYKKAKVSEAELYVEKETEKTKILYEQYMAEYKNEYLNLMSASAQEFYKDSQSMKADKALLETTLKELRSSVDAAVESAKRDVDQKNKEQFYRLIISNSDMEEIKKLQEIIPYLKNPEALNKVIWKVYYENPTTDLIGRILGKNTITGIYKITNIVNQMCYVGQAVDMGSRWKQHIKRGLGAETPTRNKLYPAMAEFGLTSFTFELIEECDRDNLDEKEDFWQDYYHAKDFGYSIK